jgi:hypothetical protein
MPAHADQRRRVVDHLEPTRVIGFADRDQADAKLACGFDLAFGLMARIDLRRDRAAAAPGECRQGVERGARAAKMIDQRAEGTRARYYGANAGSVLAGPSYLPDMPHAFKADPNHPAVAYLVRLHADLGGRILENRKEGKRLAENMKHVEAVIRLFDPAYDVTRIAARRRYKGNAWFKRGTILRHALDALRKAQGPLTAREITEQMLTARGVQADATAMRSLIASVQTSLVNQDERTVVRVGEGMPARWNAPKTE